LQLLLVRANFFFFFPLRPLHGFRVCYSIVVFLSLGIERAIGLIFI
jgi:hypothetical protein